MQDKFIDCNVSIVGAEARATIGELLMVRRFGKRPNGKKGRARVIKEGTEIRGDIGHVVSKYQDVDKELNAHEVAWYTKRVVDLATGAVLKDESQPLADHIGGGKPRYEQR